MNRRLILLCFVLNLLVPHQVSGQDRNSFSVTGERYTAENGLSQTRINTVCSDSRGFLWIGTVDGLNMYDGYTFRKFRNVPGDSSSIRNNFINSIAEDPFGNIWVGTNSGISCIEKDKSVFRNIRLNRHDSIQNASQLVLGILIPDSTSIWIKTIDYIEKYNIETGTLRSFYHGYDTKEGSSLSTEKSLVKDQGKIWFGSGSGLIAFSEISGKFRKYRSFAGNSESIRGKTIYSVFIDPQGNIWVGTEDGLNKFEPGRAGFKRYLQREEGYGYPVNDIIWDDGDLIIITDRSIIRFNEQEGILEESFSIYVNNDEIYFNQVKTGLLDRNNILWLAGLNGLIKADQKPKMMNYLNDQEYSNPVISGRSVTAIYEDQENKLWLGYDFEGVEVIEWNPDLMDENNYQHLYRELSGLRIYSISGDKHGRIWVGTSDGVYIIDRDQKVYNFNLYFDPVPKLDLNNKNIYRIFHDRIGNAWFASDEGLYRYRERTNSICPFYKIYNSENSLPLGPVYSVEEKKDGGVWIGTGNGIIFYEPENDIFIKPDFTFFEIPDINQSRIYSLFPADSGILWVGTNMGLYRINYETGDTRLYGEENGLMNNYIYEIMDDNFGNIWMSTIQGISMLDIKENKIINYMHGDGTQGYEFNPGGGFRSVDGTLYFGGLDGLNYFHPSETVSKGPEPEVFITAVEIIDKKGSVTRLKDLSGHTIHVRYDQAVRIIFAANDLSNPLENQFTYSCTKAGRRPDWSKPGRKNFVTYSNLGNNRYTFRVRYSYRDIPGESSAELRIIIDSPLWRTRVAYFFYAMLILLIIYWTVQYRTKSLRKSNRILRERDIAAREVSRQKDLLSRRNKNIEDSLKYAQRIQASMLPTEKVFKQLLPESFILHKPKDIVSGDFYWISEVNGKVFVAAVDCTGHGVPGAFMSLIGFELFRKIINTQGVEKPGEILNYLNENFEDIFGKGEDIALRDGMDLAFCVIDRENMVLEFAGAFNPIYMVRDDKLIEIKGDRMAIGADHDPFETTKKEFTTQRLKINEDDMLYLFSDGYSDQFGGPEGKKYKYRRFRHLLLTIHHFPLEKQKKFLDDSIEEWKGLNEQVDDILVIGIKPKF